MASRLSNWLIGCGVGCGLIVILAAMVAVGGVLFVRDTFTGFVSAAESREQLDERFGPADEFAPLPDGAVPADRMEAFLAVREATQPLREQITRTFRAFPMTRRQQQDLEDQPVMRKIGSVFGIVRSGFGLAKQLGTFFQARNAAMLDAEIGMGEYSYIYVMAYSIWLEHPLSEGPENVSIDAGEGDVRIGAGRREGRRIHPRLRRDLRAILRNQLAALPDTADPAWRAALASEIEMLEENPACLPWQEGLPETIAASLEPYRERLEALYSPATNPFELARNRREGRWSFQSD